MSSAQVFAAVVAACVGFGGLAQATPRLGVDLAQGYEPVPVRVGSGPQADASKLKFVQKVKGPNAIHLQDVYLRIGAVHASGTWLVELCTLPSCAPLGSATATFAPHDWNQITFAPPVAIPAGSEFAVMVTPTGSAEAEIVQTMGSVPETARTTWIYGLSMSGIAVSSVQKLDPSGLWKWAGNPVVVFTRAGETDPYAPASCAGASAIAVDGNPYFDRLPVSLGVGDSATQRLLYVDYGISDPEGQMLDLFVERSDTGLELTTLHNPDWGTVSKPVSKFIGLGADFCAVMTPPHVNPTIHTLTVGPVAAPTTWFAAVANPVPLPECHPIARATFGGSQTAAEIAGVVNPAADFGYTYYPNTPEHSFLDVDQDGFGGIKRACVPQSLRATVGGDCDDDDPLVHPAGMELCDGLDNDCDALTDTADPTLSVAACEQQLGVCASSLKPLTACVEGAWLACGAADYGPHFEAVEAVSCDGRDNDCDGQIDEELTPPLCGKQLGVCSGSTTPACAAGAWPACTSDSYGPDFETTETLCDGKDNDCDGEADGLDEDLPVPSCELTVGVCFGAVPLPERCGQAGWAACDSAEYGADYESVESRCDGLDNDCDGIADWGDADLVLAPCEQRLGVCAGATHAREHCVAAGWRACSATDYGPEYESTETSCDGLDNDCDGEVDERCALTLAPEPTPASTCAATGGLNVAAALLLGALLRGRTRRRRKAE